MGCASSTPMVATAGSEMLKAATHVAGDVQKQGEAAVAGATETLNATLDTAKETVSSAVAGITNELGNAFKDGTEALDEAKHKVMEGLHLEEAKTTTEDEAPSTSRAPTPALETDADSLKTSTPEPEIERAFTNSSGNEEEAPPTPKPSLQELAELSAQMSETSAAAAAAVAATATATAAAETATVTQAATVESHWLHRKDQEEELRRPSTTEWEMLADQLAKSRKFKPYESFVHSQNQFSVYQDYTSMRDKPGHYDGHFSGGNSQSSASQSQSDLSSGHLTPAPPRRRGGGQRDYAKFVGSEQPGSVSRASSRLSNVGSVRTFDFNPQRDRITLPIATKVGSRVGSRAGSRVGSAVNGRRSLWARGQPEVLPEEPTPAIAPLRRSSIAAGLSETLPLSAAREERNLHAYRSTSNLATSPQPQRKHRDKSRTGSLSTADSFKQPLLGSRRTSVSAYKDIEPAFQDVKHIRSEEVSYAKLTKHARDSGKKIKDLSETFKSIMLDTPSDISTALLLTTPLTVTSMLKSPAKTKSNLEKSPIPTSFKASSPLASRTSSFITEPRETFKNISSVVKHDTPTTSPQRQTPSRLKTGVLRTSPFKAGITQSEQHTDSIHQPNSLNKISPRKTNSEHSTPSRIFKSEHSTPSTIFKPAHSTPSRIFKAAHSTPSRIFKADPISATTQLKLQSPSASRTSSRISSNSSTEIIIQPLSYLNTPSALSRTSDEVMVTEYEDLELETALARLSDWRGSTTTLHSMRSSSIHMGRFSDTSSLLDSRRTSPWIRRQTEHKENKLLSSCGNVELLSPAKSSHKQLERCDICCTEFVME